LIEVAGTQRWNNDEGLLGATLKHWKPNSRARQIAHDRFRRLWKEAGWSWPQSISPTRGNGKAAAPTDGVRAFKNEETTELRQRIKRSKLSQSAAIARDLLAAFGIRPAELKGISLKNKGGQLIATVHREKTTLKGKENFREVPAAPPEDWPDDCHDLLKRLQKFGLDPGLVALRAPSDRLAKQLDRLKKSETITCEISQELTAYGLRHAFAIRLAELGLNYREAAALMGHDPATHIAIYGKRLESPKLIDKVRRARKAQSAASHPADTSEN
jgi:integrase